MFRLSIEKVYLTIFLQKQYSDPFFTQINSFFDQYPSFRVSCGPSFIPHISTFSRVGNWFRNEGISLIHKQALQEMYLGLIPYVLIDI